MLARQGVGVLETARAEGARQGEHGRECQYQCQCQAPTAAPVQLNIIHGIPNTLAFPPHHSLSLLHLCHLLRQASVHLFLGGAQCRCARRLILPAHEGNIQGDAAPLVV